MRADACASALLLDWIENDLARDNMMVRGKVELERQIAVKLSDNNSSHLQCEQEIYYSYYEKRDIKWPVGLKTFSWGKGYVD